MAFFGGAFSLTGLMGAGSIPAAILCVGVLIFFIALVMMKIFLLKTETKKKEKTMKTQRIKNQRNRQLNIEGPVPTALLTTIWDVGTKVVSGVTLLG